MEAIITAVITGVVTLVVCLINNHSTHRKTLEAHRMQTLESEAKQQQTIAIIEYKLDELTREVREHNNFARRMPVVEEQIKVINHRISDLENNNGKR